MNFKAVTSLLSVVMIIYCEVVLAAPHDQPEMDRKALQKYFEKRFPNVSVETFKDGVYAIDDDARAQAKEIDLFPPYEFELEKGKKLFETPFANGKTYSDCIQAGLLRERNEYPYFDIEKKTVKTIELEVNECRAANGEKALKYKKGDIAALTAYMSSLVRGKPIRVAIPNADALNAYRNGQEFYYAKRGYLNNSCANCHVDYAGNKARNEILHPSIGEATGWPTHRLKWDNLGTLHRRIGGCHRDQGAKPLAAQSETYRNLEYFIYYMSNGFPYEGPVVRK